MNTIELDNVLPHVFSQRTDFKSEIWQQKVTFEKGHLYLVEAMSGTGKSTLCSYILGYRYDFTGRLTFGEKDTRQLNVPDWTEIRKNHISHLFQELRLFAELSAMENVQIKNRLTNFKSDSQIKEWFDMLGIADKIDTKIGHMSFGQQQRVALIRALVQPFDFLLADEPISHLDDHNSHIMGEIMMQEVRTQGAGIIVTSIGKHMKLDYEKIFKL